MPQEIDYELCLRYVRGDASLDEAKAVRAWLSDPANELLAQHWMRQHANQLGQEQPHVLEGPATGATFDYAGMRRNLHQRMGLDMEFMPGDTATDAQPGSSMGWRRWAAAAAVACAVAGSGWLYQQRQVAPGTVVAEASYTTPYGQKQVVQLPDGSQVTLNAHSTMRFAASPQPGAPREVWLDGEAFFSVKHTPDDRRFVVHTTGGFNVEVLGTKFTVYRRREQARVVLLSGKVRVDFADQAKADVILKPGELLQTQDSRPQEVVHQAVKAPAYAAFTDDKMVFDATTIEELAIRLKDTYGVEVIVESPALRQRRFTGTFPTGDLNILVENLKEAFNLRITREGNRLILSDSHTSLPTSKP